MNPYHTHNNTDDLCGNIVRISKNRRNTNYDQENSTSQRFLCKIDKNFNFPNLCVNNNQTQQIGDEVLLFLYPILHTQSIDNDFFEKTVRKTKNKN
tara:strand:+ start:2075 stop:2362 length:288 start_codon:yes stop_codon:yes gene_type:complete